MKNYSVLRMLAVVFYIMAVVSFLFGILLCFSIISTNNANGNSGGVLSEFLVLVGSAILAFIFTAVGQLITLFINTANNIATIAINTKPKEGN